MKRIFCLSLLLVLCMTGCLPVVSGKIELHQKGWILHREQTISLSGTETEAIYEAAEVFAAETGLVQSSRQPVGFEECYTELLYLFCFEKGEARLVMEIGHDRWQLSLKKTLFAGWQVTACRPVGAGSETGMVPTGKGGDHSSPEL